MSAHVEEPHGSFLDYLVLETKYNVVGTANEALMNRSCCVAECFSRRYRLPGGKGYLKMPMFRVKSWMHPFIHRTLQHRDNLQGRFICAAHFPYYAVKEVRRGAYSLAPDAEHITDSKFFYMDGEMKSRVQERIENLLTLKVTPSRSTPRGAIHKVRQLRNNKGAPVRVPLAELFPPQKARSLNSRALSADTASKLKEHILRIRKQRIAERTQALRAKSFIEATRSYVGKMQDGKEAARQDAIDLVEDVLHGANLAENPGSIGVKLINLGMQHGDKAIAKMGVETRYALCQDRKSVV